MLWRFCLYACSAPYVARRHADVPRDLQLRMAMNEWDRDEASERIRA